MAPRDLLVPVEQAEQYSLVLLARTRQHRRFRLSSPNLPPTATFHQRLRSCGGLLGDASTLEQSKGSMAFGAESFGLPAANPWIQRLFDRARADCSRASWSPGGTYPTAGF